jgi:hypothetical protein
MQLRFFCHNLGCKWNFLVASRVATSIFLVTNPFANDTFKAQVSYKRKKDRPEYEKYYYNKNYGNDISPKTIFLIHP